MDPLDRIDEITALVETARAVPMSASCIVNREELLDRLDALRADLPAEIRKARSLLDEHEEIVAAAHREADRVIAGGLAEQQRLVSEAEVTTLVERQAAALMAEAQAEADRLRAEAEEYVDSTLAEFERVLNRTLTTVERGRERLQTRSGPNGARPVEPQTSSR